MTPSGCYDVAVLGAGVNGMVAAARLAAAGRRVVLLEAGDRPGGLARADPLPHGFSSLGALPDTAMLRSSVVERLGLERWGLELVDGAGPSVYLSPEGPAIEVPEDAAAAAWRLPEAQACTACPPGSSATADRSGERG